MKLTQSQINTLLVALRFYQREVAIQDHQTHPIASNEDLAVIAWDMNTRPCDIDEIDDLCEIVNTEVGIRYPCRSKRGVSHSSKKSKYKTCAGCGEDMRVAVLGEPKRLHYTGCYLLK